MRSQGEIRSALLILRDKRHLPYAVISQDSRCSVKQLMSAFKLEATEDVLRRLDAYLDATHLHVHRRESRQLYEYERLNREMYREYGLKNLHPLTFQAMSLDQRKRLLDAMNRAATKALCEKIQNETGNRPRFPDAFSYWRCKQRAHERGASVGAADRGARRLRRPGDLGKNGRF